MYTTILVPSWFDSSKNILYSLNNLLINDNPKDLNPLALPDIFLTFFNLF